MAFSFFGKDKQDDSLALLIDIGSSSVGVALARLEAGKPPHILATVREDIALQEVLFSARFLSSMLRSLERALKGVQEMKKVTGAPAHTFCTLSSPWFILKTRHIQVARDKSFQVTEDILADFFAEDVERLKEELKKTLPTSDIAIIEKKIIQMRLNGYEIKNPYGQTTDRMELTTTVSISSKRVIESIERKVGQIFHTNTLHFGAFPVVAFSAIRDIFPEDQNFIFLDVTGEATDASLINRDILVGTVSFPFGKNFFIREISSALRTPHEEAASLFNMFLEDTLEASKRKKIGETIAYAEEEWLKRLGKSLTELALQGALSRKVFFTADANMAGLFLKLIPRVRSEALINIALEIQNLDQLILANFVTFDTEVVRDPFIVVEVLLATKVINPHNK